MTRTTRTFRAALVLGTCLIALPAAAQSTGTAADNSTTGSETVMSQTASGQPGAAGHEGMDHSMHATPAPTTAGGYLTAAASGDQFEIQSSQLALQTSQNPEVRAFAQMMVADHTATSAELARLASANRMAAPPKVLASHHAQMLADLRAATPGGFDAAYLRHQVSAHQEALNLHRTFAQGGQSAPLRTFAAATAPKVEAHLQRAQSMAGASATPGDAVPGGPAAGGSTSGGSLPADSGASQPSASPTSGQPTAEQRAGERG